MTVRWWRKRRRVLLLFVVGIICLLISTLSLLIEVSSSSFTDDVDTLPIVHAHLSPFLIVIVPGHGDASRLPKLQATLHSLQRSASSGSVGFACVVYVWNRHLVRSTRRALSHRCYVVPSRGVWTHHMRQLGQDDVTHAWFHDYHATHVAILMDDVNVSTVDVPRLLSTMHASNLTIAAPSVHGEYQSAYPRPYCHAHVTQHVDMLFTVFAVEAWHCWYHLLNTTRNPLGWGYDIALADACQARIGIVNHETLYHTAAGTKGTQRQYDERTANDQMFGWLAQLWHVNTTQAQVQKDYICRQRPLTYDYCTSVQFQSVNASTTTLERVSPHAVILVDSMDDWFAKSSPTQSMDLSLRPWVGTSDMVLSAPRRAAPRILDHWRTLDFVAAAASNHRNTTGLVALFVATTSAARLVSDFLHATAVSLPVPVCVVGQAIVPLTQRRGPWDPTRFHATNDTVPLVLYPEPYSRLASLHRLRTTRPKVWWTRRRDTLAAVSSVLAMELASEHVPRDETVTEVDVTIQQLLDHVSMQDQLLLVDTWADAAYTAAVVALEYHRPILVRKLPGYVEYLGDDYPLFFTELDQVQHWLDHVPLLQAKLLEAHEYLQRVNISRWTVEAVSHRRHQCTVAAMASWPHG